MVCSDEVATKKRVTPGSPVGPAQAQVPWKAPCFGGGVVKNRSTAEEADSLLLRAEGSSSGCSPGLLFAPRS